MRRLASALALAALAALAACAGVEVDPNETPLCGPVASLPPLPDAGACDGQALDAYASQLSDRAVTRMSGALVRVAFDDAARVGSLCVAASNPRVAWDARRHVAAQRDALAQLAPGPACLAGRRLDLNRYQAALAEIDYAGFLCSGQGRDFEGCMEQHGDWIQRDRPGWTRPFLFVAPELADAPDLDASDTVDRCWRTENHQFDPQAACIVAAGWEMIAPPPRQVGRSK